MKALICVTLVFIALVACSNIGCGCSPMPLARALVSGHVTMDTGGPAPLAAMYAQATPVVSCVQGTLASWGRADSSGHFRLEVFGGGVLDSDSGCVFIGALYPPTSSGKDTVVGPFKLKFADPPSDSTTVNIVIHH